MIKKLITLFKLGRKIAKSDILNIASKFKKPPVAITILFQLLSISFAKNNQQKLNTNEGERLSNSLESMGTTFIKLGQFLATRPDIIGEELSTKLENLQDRLPPFSINQAQEIIKKDLGEETYNSIIDLSEPVAAASIAQVHKAKINDNGTIKDVAIKIFKHTNVKINGLNKITFKRVYLDSIIDEATSIVIIDDNCGYNKSKIIEDIQIFDVEEFENLADELPNVNIEKIKFPHGDLVRDDDYTPFESFFNIDNLFQYSSWSNTLREENNYNHFIDNANYGDKLIFVKQKSPDLTSSSFFSGLRTIAGSARSMGIDILGVKLW